MKNDISFQSRINYKGDLKVLLSHVCNDYHLEDFKSYDIIRIGYEDFNLILSTSIGNYFIKIFASFRDEEECKRYIEIITKALEAGVSHPKLFSSKNGFLYRFYDKNTETFLCVMEYIEGQNFLQLPKIISEKEVAFLIKQIALIHKIRVESKPIYDSWAITNFLQEYREKSEVLHDDDKKLIIPLVDRFSELSITTLPHCFVHGDIISPNIMRDSNGEIYIVDFAVANYYPRVQELAVLFCDVLFYPDDLIKTKQIYNFALNEYQKYIPLTSKERDVLPLYITFAHAMHLLRANYEKVVNHNTNQENEYFLDLGRKGLLLHSLS